MATAYLSLDTIKCVCAATGNDTLSGLGARDGITPTAGQIVLCPSQTDQTARGPYIARSGAWDRICSLVSGQQFLVISGTVNGGHVFALTTAGIDPSAFNGTTGACATNLAFTDQTGGANMALAGQTTGDLLDAASASAFARLADVATGQLLTSGGVGAAPAWSATPTVTTLTGSTSLLTPLLDAATAGALAIGTTTATSIALQQNVTLPTGKTLVVGANTLISSDQLAASKLLIASQAIGDLLYASSTTAWSRLADVATGSVLISGGVGAAPAWSASPTVTTLTGSTSVLTPLLDAAGATALTLGTTNATSIALQQSVTMPTGKTLTIGVNNLILSDQLAASKLLIASQAIGDLLVASSATVWSRLADVATGQVLVSGGVGASPSYSATPTVTTLTGSTSVLTPLLDTASAGALAIGTTTATSIVLQQSTSLAAGKSLTLTAGSGGIDASGATGAIKLGAASATLGFFAASVVSQQNTTGTTQQTSAGSGTAIKTDSTSTGGVGSTAYTTADVIRALKNYGLLAS